MAKTIQRYTQKVSGNRTFILSMDYISRDYIKVKVDDLDVSFTWINNNTIELTNAPSIGSIIEIRRETERSNLLVDFQNGSTLTETQLKLASNQTFNLAQEALDLADSGLFTDFKNTFNANGKRISNVADPVEDQDVATKSFVETDLNSSVKKSRDNADEAIKAANLASEIVSTWIKGEFITTTVLVETVAHMKTLPIPSGQLVETKGYHSVGDGGQAKYLIQTSAEFGGTPDEYGNHTLANGNVAVLQAEGAVNVRQFGVETKRFYIDANAPIGGNGTESLPFNSMSSATEYLGNIAKIYKGFFIIEFKAGSYPAEQFITREIKFTDYLRVRGPNVGGSPNTPVVTVMASSSFPVFRAGENDWVQVENIKVMGDGTNQEAFKVARGILTLRNCHTENVGLPITYEHGAFLSVEGGVFDGGNINNSFGVRGYYGSSHSIRSSDIASAALFKNFGTGLYINEGCFGHLDFTKIHDCGVGLRFSRVSSGSNTKQMQIYRCGTGILAENSAWMDNVVDYGLGTANACTVAVDMRGDSSEYYERTRRNAARSPKFQGGFSGFSYSNTTEGTVWTPITVRQGYGSASGDVIEITLVGSSAGSVSTSTIRLYYGSVYIGGVTVSANISRYVIKAKIFFTGTSSQRSYIEYQDISGTFRLDYTTSNVDSRTASHDVYVTAQNNNTGDTVFGNFGTCLSTIGG